MEEIKKYLEMSKNNPLFIHAFDYLTHKLERALLEKKITEEEYRNLRDKLYFKRSGEIGESIEKAFTRFSTLLRDGWYNINFNEEELRVIVLARQVASSFYGWVDLRRHQENNSYLIHYLERKAAELIPLIQEKKEERWDVFVELRADLCTALSRGLVQRPRVSTVVEVLRFMLVEEAEVKKNLPDFGIKHLNLFEGELKKIDYDIYGTSALLSYLYMTNFIEFEKKYFEAERDLKALLDAGSIDKVTHDRYHRRLAEGSTFLTAPLNIRPFEPLLTYFWCKQQDYTLEKCLLYTAKHMEKAHEFARNFCKIFTNEFFEREMILRKLNIDLNAYEHDPEVKKMTYKNLLEALDILKDFSIIPLSRYSEYKELGREKFT